MTEANNKSVKLLSVLTLLLVVAVCGLIFYVIQLHQTVNAAIEKQTNIEIVQKPATVKKEDSVNTETFKSPMWDGDFDGGFSFDPDIWDPFDEMRGIREQMNRLFKESFQRFGHDPKGLLSGGATFHPQLDMRDEGDRFVIEVDLPGSNKSKIKIDVNDRTLTISGTREDVFEEKKEEDEGHIIRRERRVGKFQRQLRLPEGIQSDKIDAKYENGILRIVIPKTEHSPQEQKSIEVQ
jgi:HSP20 family protein